LVISGGSKRRGAPGPPKAPRYKKNLRIYEDLDGGFVGDNEVLIAYLLSI